MTDQAALEEKFTVLAAALAHIDGVACAPGRRGFGGGTLQVDGHIFAMPRRGGLVLKLPSRRVADLIEAGDGAPYDAGKGRPMKEWVVVSPAREDRWLPLAAEALAFVAGDPQRAARIR